MKKIQEPQLSHSLKRRRLNIIEGLSSEDRPSTSTSAALDLPDIHVDAPPSNHAAADTHCPTEHEPIIILHEPGLSEFDHELEMAIRESLEVPRYTVKFPSLSMG